MERITPCSTYQNTIPLDRQEHSPGDLALEEWIMAIVRWNALAMVVRANKAHGELGGHITSYTSAAEVFEAGLQPFPPCRRPRVLQAPLGDGRLRKHSSRRG